MRMRFSPWMVSMQCLEAGAESESFARRGRFRPASLLLEMGFSP